MNSPRIEWQRSLFGWFDTKVVVQRLFHSRVFAGVLLVVALASVFFFREYRAIQSTAMNSWSESVSADCGVVLTGGPGRIREGLSLLENGAIKKLVISGVHSQSQFREIFPQWVFYTHVKESDVILEKRSETTYGNAQQSLPIIETLQCRDYVLITSRAHMHRSLETFRAVTPPGLVIHPHPVVSGSLEPSFMEISLEAFKSLFYSLWAYN